MNHKAQVQVILEDEKAINIYKSIKHGMRGKAIEKSLKLLIENEILKDIFFDEKTLNLINEKNQRQQTVQVKKIKEEEKEEIEEKPTKAEGTKILW